VNKFWASDGGGANICGSPIWNLPHATLRAHCTSRWFLDFWNNLCTPDLGRVPECDDT